MNHLQKLKCNGNEILVIRLEDPFESGFNDKIQSANDVEFKIVLSK